MADNAIQSFLAAHASSPSSDNNNNNTHHDHDDKSTDITAATSSTDRHHVHSNVIGPNIPHRRPACCCGNQDCVFRKHSQHALEDLERDVRTAAQLGQIAVMCRDTMLSCKLSPCPTAALAPMAHLAMFPAVVTGASDQSSSLTFALQALLVRHETYVAESECERKKMYAQLEALESEKQSLESRNTSIIEENRHLLNQLEAVNNAVSESDSRVTTLQATLISTQQELHRLSSLAARTARLDQQLADFEQERITWQTSLSASEEAEKAAVRQWHQAKRSVATLQEQVERIEHEAREERDRHAEVITRMERRYAVQSELSSAAGRLKGAAALKASTGDTAGNSVVSHFVKDILQDNANLQMGIVELRELLQTSNDEVEALRNRITEQTSDVPETTDDITPRQKDLRNELNRAASQELHVHHHYHAPPTTTEKQQPQRRRKKRYGTLSAHSSGHSTPTSSISYYSPSPAATILQQTAVTVPQPMTANTKRWSAQSQQSYYTMSGPGSPQSSTNRTSSLYDRVFSDAGLDSSRPTTPDSEAPSSPLIIAVGSKRSSFSSFRTRSAPVVQRHNATASNRQSLGSIIDVSVEQLPASTESQPGQHSIPEECEAEWENSSSPDLEGDLCVGSPTATELETPLDDVTLFQPTMRRAQSHESMFSVAGMDVHTLKSRPSQLLTPYAGRSFTSNPVLGDAQAHIFHAADISRPVDSGRELLTGMTIEPRRSSSRPSLGQKVGGWVFGRWGASPSPSPSNLHPAGSDVASVISDHSSKHSTIHKRTSSVDDAQATPKKMVVKHRTPGINQPGPIFGLLPEVRAPITPPVMNHLDDDALRTALGSNEA